MAISLREVVAIGDDYVAIGDDYNDIELLKGCDGG